LHLQSLVTQSLYQEIAMSNRITRQQLAEKIRTRSTAIVEALPEKYFMVSHLPGARHLPHDQVELLAPTVLPDRNADIVVYCANVQCQNSHIAAHALTRLGYHKVAVYAEGKQDWIESGLPVERGPSQMSRAA
jgi:rhodanese-related sulfurtransferase